MFRVASFLGAIVLTLLASVPAWAQALVKDGEEIADAKLMAAAKSEGRVALYGTYPSENLESVLDQFRKDTGLALEYVRLPTSRMYDRVLAEFAAGKLEADYVDLTDLMLIKGWMERGILAAHKVPAFSKISRELRDEQGRWYFIVRPITVISINTEMLKPADYPKSWKDLLDPKYKGQIGMPHLDAGGSAVTLYAFWRMKVAEDSWKRLAANEPRIYATAAPVQNDLVRGRISIGFTGAAGIVKQIESQAPLKIIFPEEGLAAFGAMGGVTTTAKSQCGQGLAQFRDEQVWQHADVEDRLVRHAHGIAAPAGCRLHLPPAGQGVQHIHRGVGEDHCQLSEGMAGGFREEIGLLRSADQGDDQ